MLREVACFASLLREQEGAVTLNHPFGCQRPLVSNRARGGGSVLWV